MQRVETRKKCTHKKSSSFMKWEAVKIVLEQEKGEYLNEEEITRIRREFQFLNIIIMIDWDNSWRKESKMGVNSENSGKK